MRCWGNSRSISSCPPTWTCSGRKIDAALCARKPLEQVEYRVRRKDGQVIWLETSGMPIFDGEGQFAGYRGINRDTTERKHTEMRMKLTQFSIDKAADMAVWLSRDGTLFYVNEVYCKATGYAHDELIGRKIFDVNPNFDASNWAEHWEETRRRGSMTYESTIRRKDGSLFPAEISVNFLTFEGQELHCTFMRDITDRKQAEESLQLMQCMIDNTLDEASLAGRDGRFVYVNDAKCRSLGYTRDELLSRYIWDVDPGITPERWPGIFRNLKEKGFLKVETMHKTKDGSMFPTEIWTTYMNFRGSEYVCAFVRDITERKQAETALLESREKYCRLVENVDPLGVGDRREQQVHLFQPPHPRNAGIRARRDHWQNSVRPDGSGRGKAGGRHLQPHFQRAPAVYAAREQPRGQGRPPGMRRDERHATVCR